MSSNKHIVVVGGGFAGLLFAKRLAKNLRSKKHRVTVINQHDYFLFNANLYEAATTEAELVTISQLKKSIAVPIADIFSGTGVEFINAEVKEADLKNNTVKTASQTINYDYVVFAPGSVSEYFKIRGAEEFTIPLKSVPDALKIRNQIEFAIQTASGDVKKRMVRIVVAGGGYTGVELAGELSRLVSHLSWKYNYPREKIEILVIEGAPELIIGLDPNLSKDALERLRELNVRVLLSSLIVGIDNHFIETSNGEKTTYDVIVWTAGVKARGIPSTIPLDVDQRSRVKVGSNLEIPAFPNAFVLGDTASIKDAAGHVAPPTGQDAEHEAEYLAEALPKLMNNQRPHPYVCAIHGYVVMIGGQWAIFKWGPWYLKGMLAYFAKQCAHAMFFSKLIGWPKALALTVFQIKIYARND